MYLGWRDGFMEEEEGEKERQKEKEYHPPPPTQHSQRVSNDLLLFHVYETWYWKEDMVLCQAARQLITAAHSAGPWEHAVQMPKALISSLSCFDSCLATSKYLSLLYLGETLPLASPLFIPWAFLLFPISPELPGKMNTAEDGAYPSIPGPPLKKSQEARAAFRAPSVEPDAVSGWGAWWIMHQWSSSFAEVPWTNNAISRVP